MAWYDDTISPEHVAKLLAAPGHLRHDDAVAIVRAYGKRRERNPKRCPPTFYVMTQPGTSGTAFCAPGWCWAGNGFVLETGADGCTSRQDARDTVWSLYEETWQAAHDALVAAGAIPE